MTALNAIDANQITGVLNQNTDNKTMGYGFQDTLNSIISQVNEQLQETDRMTQEFAMGKSESLHDVMLTTEKSGISLRFLLEIRAKLLEAYQEIMRMNF
ncbi:MAG: flagellar hook-basal body complex protein FliE [Deltaproteobacteria bacterium]|nr:flagellar hook-basal body complex protein FliE [Deltaproteobacteria bacterium]